MFDEAWIGVDLSYQKSYLSSFALDEANHLSERVLVLLEQVGDGNGDASADSHHAMDQNIGFLPGLLDEVKSLVEVLINLIILVILDRYVEIMRHFLSLVAEQPAPSNRQNCLDSFLLI